MVECSRRIVSLEQWRRVRGDEWRGSGAPGSQFVTLYLYGQVGGVADIFQWIDEGASWTQIDDPQHQYGVIRVMAGDPNVFGRVYLGTASRGIVYRDLALSDTRAQTVQARHAEPNQHWSLQRASLRSR